MRFHYYCFWFVLRLLFRVYFRWRIVGTQHVSQNGPVILASNHASYLDPMLIGSAVDRPIFYLARKSLFRHWAAGPFLRSVNALPVDRAGKSFGGLKALLGRLTRGNAVLVFPEGTRTRDGSLQRAHAGVGLLAVKSGAKVIPTRLYGSHEAWNRRMRFPRPRRITVVFGPPLEFEIAAEKTKAGDRADSRNVRYTEAADQIMQAISETGADEPLVLRRHQS